jgi:hypothetical protein
MDIDGSHMVLSKSLKDLDKTMWDPSISIVYIEAGLNIL